MKTKQFPIFGGHTLYVQIPDFQTRKKKKKNALEGFLIAMTIARGLGLFTWF